MNVRISLGAGESAKIQRHARRGFVRTQQQCRGSRSRRIVRGCFLRAGEVCDIERRLLAGDFVNRAVRVRHDKQIAVRRCLNVSGDSEVSTDKQRLAFLDVELVVVVGDEIIQT